MHSTLYDDPTRLQTILYQTLSIVAYSFLYIFASGIACLLGVALSRLYEKLVLGNKWRGFCDWDSTTQSVCALLAVLGFLTTAECLFALHFSGRVDLEVTEQVAVALFGITVFGLACTGVLVFVAVLREGVRMVLGRVNPAVVCDAVIYRKRSVIEEDTEEEDEDDYGRSRLATEHDLEAGEDYTETEEEEDEDEWESESYHSYPSIKMRKIPFVRDSNRKKAARTWLPLVKGSKKSKRSAFWTIKVA